MHHFAKASGGVKGPASESRMNGDRSNRGARPPQRKGRPRGNNSRSTYQCATMGVISNASARGINERFERHFHCPELNGDQRPRGRNNSGNARGVHQGSGHPGTRRLRRVLRVQIFRGEGRHNSNVFHGRLRPSRSGRRRAHNMARTKSNFHPRHIPRMRYGGNFRMR